MLQYDFQLNTDTLSVFNNPTTFQFILNLFPNNSIPVNDRATLLIGVLKTR